MDPAMTTTTKEDDMRRERWWKRILGPVQDPGPGDAVGLRYAAPADAGALARLAEIDSSHAPRGVVLVAEVEGEMWAAVSVDDGHAVADPFRPTGELVHRMMATARRLRRAERERDTALPRVWPAAPAA
jgi:hypothetical protein